MAIRVMDSHWEAIFQYSGLSPDHPYLPNSEKPVFVLGRLYSSLKDRETIHADLRSRFWMTYRKGFSPIGSQTGPKSDAGWGCMHRCGQMMLAETLTQVHLGRDWRWHPGCRDTSYLRLRRLFQDRRSALYSIHTITLMGVAVGKPIGSWFGPNTMAQVIKKLSVYDRWTNLVVHIAVEDGVIVNEIKAACKRKRSQCNFGQSASVPSLNLAGTTDSSPSTKGDEETDETQCFESFPPSLPANKSEQQASDVHDVEFESWTVSHPVGLDLDDSEPIDIRPHLNLPVTHEIDDDCVEIVFPPTFGQETSSDLLDMDGGTAIPADSTTTGSNSQADQCRPIPSLYVPAEQTSDEWRPLLLFVPLRLGLHSPNPSYFEPLKALLRLPHCVGILGGRPSHAVWIVGLSGDDVICLDPHVCQPASRLKADQLIESERTEPDDHETEQTEANSKRTSSTALVEDSDDRSHHCTTPIRMPLSRLDPSMVVGFLCPREQDLDNLVSRLCGELIPEAGNWSLFEVHLIRPANLPPVPTAEGDSSSQSASAMLMSVFTVDR